MTGVQTCALPICKNAEALVNNLNHRLEQRIRLLTHPVTDFGGLEFSDLFDLDEIQKLQDLLADTLNVASIITDTNGNPITRPSNFCSLCRDIIRGTEKGMARCMESNALFSVNNSGETLISCCHSAGLMDGGTSIFVGNRRIANWLVGQVMDESYDENLLLDYADEIGADREEFREALSTVPRIGRDHFRAISNLVAQIAHQLSAQALRNYQQARAIEERIKTEEVLDSQRTQLLQTSSKLQTIIDTIGDGITLSDREGRFSIYNSQMQLITGYSMEEANACDSFLNLLYADPEERKNAIEELAILERHGTNHNVETTITSKDGSLKTLSLSSVMIDLDGERHYLSAWHDFTNRKILTDALITSEQKFSAIARSAGDAIIMVNDAGRITYWNPAAEEIFGYTLDEAVGRDVHLILAPERYQEQAITAIKHWSAVTRRTGIYKRADIYGHRKDGTEFPIDLTLSTVDLGGSLTAIAILRDITERHQAARELVAAKEAAEEASLAKSNFLANMSHELRTPLNSIIGFTELVNDGVTGPVNEQQQEYLENVLTSSRHLLQIISEILDLSRIEAGKMMLDMVPVEVGNLILQVQSIFSCQFSNRGIEFTTATTHPDGLVLRADEVKLRQVIINLLSNALKFTDPGGKVVLGTRITGNGMLAIEVQDTGIGMKPEDIPKLFKEFSQIEPAMTRNRDGTGLGLALSKRLVELHNGMITVSSTFGKGSTFIVELPLTGREGEE